MNETLQTCAEELRTLMFQTLFWKPDNKDTPFVLVQYGVKTKMMTPQEGNDWLDVMRDKKTLMEVSAMYGKKDTPESAVLAEINKSGRAI